MARRACFFVRDGLGRERGCDIHTLRDTGKVLYNEGYLYITGGDLVCRADGNILGPIFYNI